jgi:3-oxoacid CoA-transferase subunit B
MIITDLAVFNVSPNGGGLELIELADGVAMDEVKAKTEAAFAVAETLKAVS